MNKVIACINGASNSTTVCDYAIWAAQRLQAPLEFLHVIEQQPDRTLIHDLSGSVGLGAQEILLAELTQLDEQNSKIAEEQAEKILEAALQYSHSKGVDGASTRRRLGILAEVLLELQDDTRLVVLGQRPQPGGVSRLTLDLNVERVVRSLQKPVLVATSKYTEPSHFAIAFDGSPTGCKMIERVAASPLLQNLPCHIITAGNPTSSGAQQLEWARTTLADAGFAVSVIQQPGDAQTVLHSAISTNHIDLLVMGAYGHSRIREFIVGSTTTTMLRTSPVPVLILR